MATKENGRSLPDLMKQLAALQKEVEQVKTKEKTEVIGRMHEAIEVYGITVDELFPSRGAAGRKAAKKPNGNGEAKPKRVYKKRKPAKRARRTFTDAQKADYLAKHTALVTGGSTFDAAAKKLDVQQTILRKWYRDAKQDYPERKAA